MKGVLAVRVVCDLCGNRTVAEVRVVNGEPMWIFENEVQEWEPVGSIDWTNADEADFRRVGKRRRLQYSWPLDWLGNNGGDFDGAWCAHGANLEVDADEVHAAYARFKGRVQAVRAHDSRTAH